MTEIPSNHDPDSNLARPSMIVLSGREAEFQNALDRYLADYRKHQALMTQQRACRLGARLRLARRIADWPGRKFRARTESSARSGQTLLWSSHSEISSR